MTDRTHEERMAELRELFDARGELRAFIELCVYANHLASQLEAERSERLAAIKEMAKARRHAQDVQCHFEMDHILMHERTQERGGQFAVLYNDNRKLRSKLQAAERVVEAARHYRLTLAQKPGSAAASEAMLQMGEALQAYDLAVAGEGSPPASELADPPTST